MSASLHIAVVKPDWRAQGGFERLLDRLVSHLEASGHRITPQPVPAILDPRPVWGVADAERCWSDHPEYFRYLALLEDTRRLDLRRFDLVLSTQPPTFHAPHENVLALFYHQARVFYDLAEPYARLGEVSAEHHQAATDVVRDVDRSMVGDVRHWLAGSNECAGRLDEYWNLTDNVSLLHAPPLTEAPPDPPPWDPRGPVVCVSRHEWPKRTELLVAAGHVLGDRTIEFVGAGGRLDYVRKLDDALARDRDLVSRDASALWMESAMGATAPRRPASTRNHFLVGLDDDARNARYAAASVVVAPAYREDYGLTALEAMLWQRPLIVCNDGGGLVDLVKETGAGHIVDPTPQAIAEGIRHLTEDPANGARLIERSKEVPAAFTWKRCHAELDAAVASAMCS